MSLNTILVGSFIISSIIYFTESGLLFNQYLKNSNKLLFIFSISWFLWAFGYLLLSLSHYYFDAIFMKTSYFFHVFSLIGFVLFFNFLKKDSINAIQIIFSSLIGTLFLVLGWLPYSTEITPNYGIHVIGFARIGQFAFMLYLMYLFLIWGIQTLKHSPHKLHGASKILMLGIIIQTIIAFLLYILGTFVRWVGAFVFLIQAIGTLLIVIVLIKEPKLLYILPFVTYKFMIVSQDTGDILYEYNWFESESDTEILSKFLAGLNEITLKVLAIGRLQQIKLSKGYLLIDNRDRFTIGLTTSRTSTYLVQCMNNFAIDFERKVNNFDNPIDSYKKIVRNIAQDLLNKHFSNIPSSQETQ